MTSAELTMFQGVSGSITEAVSTATSAQLAAASPCQPAPDDAPTLDRLAAFTGRPL